MMTGLGLAAMMSPMSGDLPKRSRRTSRTSAKCLALSMSANANRRDASLMEMQIIESPGAIREKEMQPRRATEEHEERPEKNEERIASCPFFILLRSSDSSLRVPSWPFVVAFLVGRDRLAQGRPFVVEALF